jgi:hypothetical protein
MAVPTTFRLAEAGRGYHTAESLEFEDIFVWSKVVEQFEAQDFMRDGVLILTGVMTPLATRRLRESCERVQRENDSWLDHDWHEPTQWAPLGMRPPTCEPLSEAEKARARGACQVLNGVLGRIWRSVRENTAGMFDDLPSTSGHGGGQLRDATSTRWPFGKGFAPEMYPSAYDGYMLEMHTHPQMVRLHQLMLGPEIRSDHHRILSRREFRGQGWHSHDYVEDVSQAKHALAHTTRTNVVLTDWLCPIGCWRHHAPWRCQASACAHTSVPGRLPVPKRRWPQGCAGRASVPQPVAAGRGGAIRQDGDAAGR